jgi:hypothetical protein
MEALLERVAAHVRRSTLVLAFAVVSLAPLLAHAQSSRAGFFLQMLRQNPDPRVRVSAALRLQELHEAATAQAIIQAYGSERDPTVLAAMISALAAIGDPAALPIVQQATRNPNPSVVAQARRALPLLQSAASNGGNNGGQPNGGNPPPSSAQARFLVGVGTVNNQSGVRGSQLSQIAQQALQNALQSRSEVVLHQGNAASGQTTMRQRHLTGHFFDANIQSLQPRGNGVRASVSIAVSTYPGRVYEFESQTAITISGGSGDSQQVENDAVRRAIESAAGRAVQQLMQTPP